MTFTATATTHYFVIEKEAIPPMTLGSCNQLEVDDVVLTQANTINDNFATIGNTAGYIGTNATLSNTNNTLEIATGIAPVVSKIYNGIAGGKYNINFDLIAGDCAPLSLTSKYVRYDLVYNGASILSGNALSSTQLSNITLPATGTYTLQFSIINKMATPLACQLAIDNIRWDRQIMADEFASAFAGWTPSTSGQLAILNGTLQLKNTQRATRTQAVTANKNYNLSLTMLKGTACSSSTVTIRVKNGTTLVAQVPITISSTTAASVPVSLDFTFPSTSLTLEVERTNFNVATCSALQLDNVYLTEKDWINETFATLDNTSGYSANTGSNVVLSNTNQSLQIAPTLLSASNGIRKNIDLDAGIEYTFSYDIAAQTPLSNKNYILCELFYGTNALYSYKIMSTQSNSFVYTPTSSGTYTWRFRRVCTGATAPASSYTVDNLKVSYVIPYTRTECPETDLAYRFGFNGKEKDNEVMGEGNTYAFEARTFDSRIGKWLSLDPREKEYPWQTPYAYYANSPIWKIDFKGEGDYYDRKGNCLGNDGVDDRKTYLMNEGMRPKLENKTVNWGGTFSKVHTRNIKRNSTEVSGLIIQNRIEEGEDYTISEFKTVGGEKNVTGFILEPAGPSTKESGQDKRVPEGVYNIENYSSDKYPDNFLLYNKDVSKDRKILYHSGNNGGNTEGCNMPGTSKDSNAGTVGGSKPKMQELRTFIKSKGASNVKTIINKKIPN